MYYSASANSFFADALRRQYIAAGNWPDDIVEVSDDEYRTYSRGAPPAGMTRGSDENGRPCWVEKPPEPLTGLAARKRRDIDNAYAAALRKGLPYTMPNGTDDVIQTRPEDEANLLGLAIEARDLRDAGEAETMMELRAQSNTVYALTPAQMIAATDAAKAFKKSLLKRSWQRKGEIDTALDAEDRAALEAVAW